MVLEQPVWILTVASVGGPTRRLDVGDTIGLGSEHTEKGLGMHCPCPNLNVIRLLDHAPSITPIFLQLEDEVLKCRAFYGFRLHFRFHRFHFLPFQMFFWRLVSSRCGSPEHLMHSLRFPLRDRLADFPSTICPRFPTRRSVQLKVLL